MRLLNGQILTCTLYNSVVYCIYCNRVCSLYYVLRTLYDIHTHTVQRTYTVRCTLHTHRHGTAYIVVYSAVHGVINGFQGNISGHPTRPINNLQPSLWKLTPDITHPPPTQTNTPIRYGAFNPALHISPLSPPLSLSMYVFIHSFFSFDFVVKPRWTIGGDAITWFGFHMAAASMHTA